MTEDVDLSQIKKSINKRIEYIESFNAATLLGTLETADTLQSLMYKDVGCSIVDTNEKYERGEISTAQFVESLKKELDLDITDEEVLEGWNKIFVGENLGIRDNIDRLVSKYPLYIFSNTSVSHAEFWRNEYSELLKHFQKIFTSFELGMRKPEKESFLEVCSQIDVLPEKILFFDDTEENIVAANDLGMHAVKVDSIQDISETIEKLC